MINDTFRLPGITLNVINVSYAAPAGLIYQKVNKVSERVSQMLPTLLINMGEISHSCLKTDLFYLSL